MARRLSKRPGGFSTWERPGPYVTRWRSTSPRLARASTNPVEAQGTFMGVARTGPKLFTCPQCRNTYLGHDPVPDCPSCGYDYRAKGGFRWDVLVYLLSVVGMLSYFLVS